MAATVRFKLIPGAVEKLLESPEIAADLERRARNVAAAAGPGHTVAVEIGPERARASVATDTIDAIIAELQTRNLTRALDAARG